MSGIFSPFLICGLDLSDYWPFNYCSPCTITSMQAFSFVAAILFAILTIWMVVFLVMDWNNKVVKYTLKKVVIDWPAVDVRVIADIYTALVVITVISVFGYMLYFLHNYKVKTILWRWTTWLTVLSKNHCINQSSWPARLWCPMVTTVEICFPVRWHFWLLRRHVCFRGVHAGFIGLHEWFVACDEGLYYSGDCWAFLDWMVPVGGAFTNLFVCIAGPLLI